MGAKPLKTHWGKNSKLYIFTNLSDYWDFLEHPRLHLRSWRHRQDFGNSIRTHHCSSIDGMLLWLCYTLILCQYCSWSRPKEKRFKHRSNDQNHTPLLKNKTLSWTQENWENIDEIWSNIHLQTQTLLESFLYCFL